MAASAVANASTLRCRACSERRFWLAICTHLGGALRWNEAEQSWDCPLRGSRFTANGKVLEGPATKALAKRH